jgi:ATP-dependent Clp protease ATP-binding subunit ClpA
VIEVHQCPLFSRHTELDGQPERAQHIEVQFSDGAVKLLAKEVYDPEYGARPLRRTIQRLVENDLSRQVLSGEIEPGDKVRARRGDDLKFDVEKGAAQEVSSADADEMLVSSLSEH